MLNAWDETEICTEKLVAWRFEKKDKRYLVYGIWIRDCWNNSRIIQRVWGWQGKNVSLSRRVMERQTAVVDRVET